MRARWGVKLRSAPIRLRRRLRRPEGDRLETRTLLADSTLSAAVPLHFGLLGVAAESRLLSSPREVDYYSVTLARGDKAFLRIDAQRSGSGLNTLLRVFDSAGTPLALDNQQGGDPELTFQAATTGTYYLGVSAAPNSDYDPRVAGSGTPGGSTGLYSLSVRRTTAPEMPDLTGGSFRAARAMAAPSDAVPVSFTVENRGGADPGDFRVQVLLASSTLLDSSARVLATLTRGELLGGAAGRSFTSPVGFKVNLPADALSGPAYLGLRILSDPGVPDAGLFDKGGVHRGSDWAPLTVVTVGPSGVTDLSAIDGRLYTETFGTIRDSIPLSVRSLTITAAQGVGQFAAEVDALGGTMRPLLTLSGPNGKVLVQSAAGRIVQSLAPGTYQLTVSSQAGEGSYRLTTAFTPTSSPFAALADGPGTSWVSAGDLNADGVPDIVVTNRVDDTVKVYLGLGDGTFKLPQSYPAGQRTWTVTIADANGDGKPDIVTVNKGDDSISILANHGDGTFEPQAIIRVGSRPGGVVVADLNGDGFPDLVVNNYAADTIEVIPGQGGGTFGPSTLYPTGQGAGFTGPITPTVADLNGDGIPDLIYPNYVARDVAVRLGNGDGKFGPLSAFPVGAGAHSVAVLDANGDGIMDLAAGNAVDDSVSVLLGHGDGTFQPQRVYPVGFDPYSLTVADLNGDGIRDIITANRGDNTLSVLLGDGHGGFSAQPAYPTGSAPRGIAAADFNGDGHVDLVNANQADGTATVHWGNGDGTLALGAQHSAPAPTLRPFQVQVADVNGDGIPDILSANRSDNSVSVILGNRDGSYQSKQTFPTGRLPISVAAADVSGDGIPDILTANYGGSTVSILRGNGDGTFRSFHDIPAGSDPYNVKVADLNGDGKPDIVVTNKNDNTVGVILGKGDGSFQAMATYAVASGPYRVVVADIDGNRIPDLVVSHFSATVVDVLLGDGDGRFRPAREFPVASRPYGLAVADVNGDGLADIVTSNYRDNNVSVLLNEGGGNLGAPRLYEVGKGPNEVQVADVNGDGRPDILAANYGTSDISVLLGHGDGTFGPAHGFAAGKGPASLAVADLNGDGKPDVVVGNRNGSTVSVLTANGDGTFRQPFSIGAGKKSYSFVVADLNGDGDLDVAKASEIDGLVTVQAGNNDGTFGPGQSFAVGPSPTATAVADLNRDGRPDLVTANSEGNSVSVLLGNGDGTFSVEQRFPVGRSPRAIALADLNGDGIPDIAVADYNDNSVSLLLGKGDGTFLPREVIPVGNRPYSVAAADLTGDGRIDLVVADSASNSVTVLRNRGQGRGPVVFAPPITMATGRRPISVAVADVSGDGIPDLLTADAFDDAVSVLEGLGDGTFQPRHKLDVGSRPYSVSAVDLNGDGLADIVTTGYAANAASVLINGGAGSFAKAQSFATDLRPVGTSAADLNGDGRPDLITASNQDSAIGVLLGRGDGSFEPVPAGGGVGLLSTPFLIDLNGDGLADSVVLDRSGEILVRTRIPSTGGAFSPPVVLNPGRPARAIAVLRIGTGNAIAAADTHFDPALSTRQFLFTVSLYTLSRGGQVSRRMAWATTDLPTGLAVADLTGDGLDDLIASNALENSVTIAYQVAPGQFGSTRSVPVGIAPSDIAISDLNGDGRTDLVVSDQASGDVTVLLNDASGTFGRTLRLRASTGLYGLDVGAGGATITSFAQTAGLVAGNFTGSGHDDLVVLNRGAHSLTVLVGDGTGSFADPSGALTTSTSDGSRIVSRPGALAAADFNRDGNLDLAILMEDVGELWIYAGNGDGTFRHTFSIPVGSDANGLSVAAGNGPGLWNLLVGNGFGDVLILLGRGDGTFQIRGSRVSLSVVPDLLGPGQAGVLVGNQEANRVTIQGASGSGDQYTPVQTLGASSATTQQIAPGDVQWAFLDAHATLPDAIVVSTGANAVVVYRTLSVSDGVPTFASSPRTYFVGTAPTGLTVADVNGDAIPDLLIADEGSNDISVVFGSYDSQGHWEGITGPRLKSGGAGPIAVAVRDLNGDGIPDLAVFNGGSGTVTALPGVGRGFFDDRRPPTLFDFRAALLQPPTFVGTTGLGYAVTAGGDLVRFNLSSPGEGVGVVYAGQHVEAARALATGQVVAVLTNGAVNLLGPQGGGLVLVSVLQAQGGVPALPSSIEVVSKPDGQFSVLVSSKGSDHIFVYSQGQIDASVGVVGPVTGSPSPPAFNTVQSSSFATTNQGATFTGGAISTSVAASGMSSSSASTSSSSISSTAAVSTTAAVGLSLGTFSSLGSRAGRGAAAAVLVPVEDNSYLRIPILEFGSADDEAAGGGEGRMPELMSRYSFGDLSDLTRFVTGLDEALEEYRGQNQESSSRESDPAHDPWREDLFAPHLPRGPRGVDPEPNEVVEPEAPGPAPPAAVGEGKGISPIPRSPGLSRATFAAGLVVCATALSSTPLRLSRQTLHPGGPIAAGARSRRRGRTEAPSPEPQS